MFLQHFIYVKFKKKNNNDFVFFYFSLIYLMNIKKFDRPEFETLTEQILKVCNSHSSFNFLINFN